MTFFQHPSPSRNGLTAAVHEVAVLHLNDERECTCVACIWDSLLDRLHNFEWRFSFQCGERFPNLSDIGPIPLPQAVPFLQELSGIPEVGHGAEAFRGLGQCVGSLQAGRRR